MKKRTVFFAIYIAWLFSITFPAAADTWERKDISEELTWRLEDIYTSDQAWQDSFQALSEKMKSITKYKGKLGESADELIECLKLDSDISKELSRLSSYASMKADQDLRNSRYLALQQKAHNLSTEYRSLSSFIKPEISKIDAEKIDEFLKEKGELGVYKLFLKDIQRTKVHRLSESEEKILADVGLFASGPENIYSIFTNAEMPYPEVTLSNGRTVKITKAAYTLYRAEKSRADREKVFKAFFGSLDSFKETFAAQLYENIKKDVFYARTRKYESSLHAALDSDNIPVEVFNSLVDNVHKNLNTLHRYLKLKKRILSFDVLQYSDLYVTAVEGVDANYTPEQAEQLILKAAEPLGKEYTDILEKAFTQRWIDYYPTPGKRAGAYSNGSVYDGHPFILMNYNGKYDDVSTLAHELGHSLHSYLSNTNQPYPTADYSFFVAEVASTFNEVLLIDKVLEQVEDDNTKLAILTNYLENARVTLFRQTLFAEFELKIHQLVEQDQPLTGDLLNQIYGDLLKLYYGHDKGVCHIDDLYSIEWAYVPHFYYDFYIYQYATSFCASQALSKQVLDNQPGVVDKYLNLLKSGGSDYPINLLKNAGLDMTTSEPFNQTIAVMNDVMDRIEQLLDTNKAVSMK